jgi:hypothetical protein
MDVGRWLRIQLDVLPDNDYESMATAALHFAGKNLVCFVST